VTGPRFTLPVLAALLADTGEAPQRDCCRPHGIPIDRRLCPPDSETTDRFAALAAEIDGWAMFDRSPL